MSNIIQPIRQYELHVRSKDAQVTGDLNSHLFIDLKEPIIVNARDEEIHMIISTGEIPYSFYNISSNVDNDRILLNGSTTYTITNKNYDVYELAKVFGVPIPYTNPDAGTVVIIPLHACFAIVAMLHIARSHPCLAFITEFARITFSFFIRFAQRNRESASLILKLV